MPPLNLIAQTSAPDGLSASGALRMATQALWQVLRSVLSVLGLVVVGAAAALTYFWHHPEWPRAAETHVLGWLQLRQDQRDGAEADPTALALALPEAVQRTTATPAGALPDDQRAVATWLARRYRVAADPVAALVAEAWKLGPTTGVPPTLLLAIVALESGFNPFAQSPVGAQGLMQVLTRVHDDKYKAYGGTLAAFDPIANLRVGALVLRESIRRAGGDVSAGLRHYVGAALLEHDGGYARRVLTEQAHLDAVSRGKRVSTQVTLPALVPLTSAAADPAS